MIRINLLGKKKAQAPFGLDPVLEKLGIKSEDLWALRPALIKIAIVLGLLYLGDSVPTYIIEKKAAEIDKQAKVFTDNGNKLQAELNSKKELRKQMEQLQRDEADINKQLSAINGLTKDRTLVFKSLDSLSAALPAKVWITKLDYMNKKVSLKGSSWEYFAVNEFVKSLNENTSFNSVNLSAITSENNSRALVSGVSEADQSIKSFDLEFILNGST